MASFTLGTAAAATGTAKSTILRAIRAGRISATRDDLGQWMIDPAELNRCFPLLAIPGTEGVVKSPETHTQPAADHDATTTTDVLVSELRTMLADLRRDRDHWREAHERGQAALHWRNGYCHPPSNRTHRRTHRRSNGTQRASNSTHPPNGDGGSGPSRTQASEMIVSRLLT
jgi:hypothetical protein